MAAHRYWRFKVNGTNWAGFFSCAAIEAAEYIGGPDVFAGITPTASSANDPPSNLVTPSLADFYHSNDVLPHTLIYDLGGSPADVQSLRVTNRAGFGAQCATSITLSYSDDGMAWTDVHTWAGIDTNEYDDFWPIGKIFSVPGATEAPAGYIYWKMVHSALMPGAVGGALRGAEMDVFVAGIEQACHKAFGHDPAAGDGRFLVDNDPNSNYVHNGVGGFVIVQTPGACLPSAITWTAQNDGNYLGSPVDGEIFGSNDLVTWTSVGTFEGLAWSAGLEQPLIEFTYSPPRRRALSVVNL